MGSAALVVICPHCRGTATIELPAPVAVGKREREERARVDRITTKLLEPDPLKPSKGVCGCGHEKSHHEGGTGTCRYGEGIGTTFGKCECVGYHSRKRKTPVANGAPSRLLVPGAPAGLGKGERAVLIAAAQHPNGVTREQLTVLTGYKRSSRDTFVQRLKAAGYLVDGGAELVAVEKGRVALGSYEKLPTGKKLGEYWLAKLSGGEQSLYELVFHSDRPLTREELSEMSEYRRSSRDTFIQRLRVRGLVVEGPEGVSLSKHLS